MENTYWNEHGKHQKLVNSIERKMPSMGYTSNIYMNLYITASKLYYNYHNNGDREVEDYYMSQFNRDIKPYIPDFDITAFAGYDEQKVEQMMDKVFEYLEGKPLDFIGYTVWLDFDGKCFTREEPADVEDKRWHTVTFGNEETMKNWCKERLTIVGEKDITDEIKAEKADTLPEFCFSVRKLTGELIYIEKDTEGFFRSEWSTENPEKNKELAAYLNKKAGLSEYQVKAMEFGSMFGWDKPGAKPSAYMKEPLNTVISGAEEKASEQRQDSMSRGPLDIEH